MMQRLSLEADIDITLDDGTVLRVTGTGEQSLTVQLPSLRVGFSLWRKYRQTLFPLLQRVTGILPDGTVVVNFTIDDVLVATLDAGTPPNWLSRALGIAPITLKPAGVARSLFS